MLAEKRPDLFAGIEVWQPITLSDKGINKPIDFVENLFNVPVQIFHGQEDPISPVINSRRFVAEAKKFDIHLDYHEYKGGHLFFEKGTGESMFKYFDSIAVHSPPSIPSVVKYSTYDLDVNSVYWLRINEIEPTVKARIQAEYDASRSAFDITVENISGYTILYNKMDQPMDKMISITSNGTLYFQGLPLNELDVIVTDK